MLSNKQAIGSLSLGQHSTHTLDQKILAAARHGFTGLEIVYLDLENYAKHLEVPIHKAAEVTRDLCLKNNVEIISLAPFENFEGGSSPLSERLTTAKHWLQLARTLQATYLQVPSYYNPDGSTDEKVVVSDLQQLANLASAAEPVISIAYEYLSWGVFCSTWETALRLVNAVDRPNFGLCLDNFHEHTRLWGSNVDTSGKLPAGDQGLEASLRRFSEQCPVDKIFYVQLSDAERFDPPLSETHPWYQQGEAPQFTWSKHARPFPLESELGGYLPILEIVKTWVVDKGFKGWVSMEVFDWRMRRAEHKVEDAAKRARVSWDKIQRGLSEKDEKGFIKAHY
ncbi:sugar phosphate isomerase/epimerase family protein [Aspergillus homomorphus CBS 101889]|uniref:4-hydroxyphenylpyruvate dioxygenase n=1 Tax=Aspergillus homomorphus (strain CBS 101889) TaxID=1450537 RepID=A0A395HS53_ASPHC|nr:4-hydroxyphenylpyruvate dioxygenase [Aspergillus homomorphus CBS 101889]RAL10253.1 4-hydroxyphenylpyruvate dioxygenase [Aspergillus homomorphus CBS 101889]